MRTALFIALTLVAQGMALADGTTDILLNPAATYNISAPGSYRLVQGVTMTAPVTCIQILADDVRIDLNGHTIVGTGAGTGHGIVGAANRRLTILNGVVRNFGGHGIFCNLDLTAHDLTVQGNVLSGITGTTGSSIRSVLALDNGAYGIYAEDSSLIEGCRALGNCGTGSFSGIHVGQTSSVINCTSDGNSPDGPGAGIARGIDAGNHCIIRGNTAANHLGTAAAIGVGIATGAGCTISDNTVRGNVGGPSGGSGIGIQAGAACIITGNTALSNTGNNASSGFGITAGSNSNIRGNIAQGNNGGTSGNATGINAGTHSTIEGNTCASNVEGATGDGISLGINAAIGCLLRGNVCDGNSGTGASGTGVGIVTSSNCTLIENQCRGNLATGTGTALGIQTLGDCLIERNHSVNNTGGTGGAYGIFVGGTRTVVRANATAGNGTAGIRLNAADNRSEQNRMAEAAGVSAVAGNSLGAGDLADIIY